MEENVKSNFFIALSEKICKLQKEEGLKFSLTELAAKPEKKNSSRNYWPKRENFQVIN